MASAYLSCRADDSEVTFSSMAAAGSPLGLASRHPPRFFDLARHLQRRDQFARGHGRCADGGKALAPDRGMHHAQDQHQHRRHQVDRDRAGPARDEIAGIAQYCFGGRHRLEPRRFDARRRQDFFRSIRQ
jgi:hypothetical protein